jgi:hypothetical protein
LWQDLQAPAVTTLWFMLIAVFHAACDRWQESQRAGPAGTGMCAALLPVAVLPLWQVSQVPVPTALAGEWVKLTVPQLLVDLWQLSQLPVMLAWMALAGLPTADR